MVTSIKDKAIKGFFWSAIDSIGQQAVQFIVSVVIARLLVPQDYGLIGMITIFMNLATVLVDSGFGNALIQKKNPTEIDYSTIFYFNIATSLFLYLIIFFAAPFIAVFFNQPELTLLTRIIALCIIINATSIIQINIFTKNINFKIMSLIGISTVFVSGVVGIILAYRGWGFWSLVILQIVSISLKSILLWIYSKWRPIKNFSYNSLKQMFPYSSKILLSGFSDTLFVNLYNIFIGKFYSTKDLGFFTQAQKIQSIPITVLSSVVSKVSFPVFASIQDDDKLLKKGYKKIMCNIVFITFPLMIGLMVTADVFVKTLLGPKWLPCATYLRLLCVAGMTYPLSAFNLNIVNVKGRSDIFLYLEIIKKILMVSALLLTFKYGIKEIVAGYAVFTIVAYLLNSYFSGKFIHYSLYEQIKDIVPYFILALIMGIIIFLINYLIYEHDLGKFVIQICIGLFVYLGSAYLLRLRAFFDYKDLIYSFLKKKSK